MADTPPMLFDWTGEAMVPLRNARAAQRLPSRSYLMECFEYHAGGYLVWKERPAKHFHDVNAATQWNRRYAHNRAGYQLQTGYRFVSVGGLASRESGGSDSVASIYAGSASSLHVATTVAPGTHPILAGLTAGEGSSGEDGSPEPRTSPLQEIQGRVIHA